MRRSLFLIILIGWVFLVHCATEQKITQLSSTPQEKCDTPIWDEGDSWKYRLENKGTFEDEVTKVEKDLYVLDSIYGHDKKTLELKFYIDSEGKKGMQRPVSNIFFDFPLYVGKKWGKYIEGRNTEGGRSDQLYTFKVISVEDVTVPAGTFKAFKIEREGHPAFISYLWYSPEVKNIIKYMHGSSDFRWHVQSHDYELVEYDLITSDLKNASTYFKRGNTYRRKGQFHQAISAYTKALELNPTYHEAYNHRGIANRNIEQYDQAISDYNKAIELSPKDAVYYNNRGFAYDQKGEYDQAISDYNKAIAIDPGYALAYCNRGLILAKKRDYNQAISDFNKALQIDSKYTRAYNGLAWLYATAKIPEFQNGKKAVELAIKACELSNWKNSNYLDTLAAAYARNNDFKNAVKWQEKALESCQANQKAEFQERINLYRKGKPWPPD